MINNDLCNYWYQKEYENKKRRKKMKVKLTLLDNKITELEGDVFMLYDISIALEMAAIRYKENNMKIAGEYYSNLAFDIYEQIKNRKE